MWWRRKGKENPPYPDGRCHIDQPLKLLWAFNAIGTYYEQEGDEK